MAAEKRAREQDENWLAPVEILNNADVGIFTIDKTNGTVVSCNEKVCSDIQKPRSAIVGKTYTNVFWDDLSARFETLLTQNSEKKAATGIYYWRQRIMWVLIAVRTVLKKGMPPMAVISVTNVTRLSLPEQDIKTIAFYDPQLGIANGRQLEKDVSQLPSYQHVALVHFDISKFSTINEVYGWDAGDYVLEQIRDWMLETAVEGCRLYRVSEDEFGMLIRNISLASTKKRAKQVLNRFKQPWRVGPTTDAVLYCNVTMSIVYGPYVGGDVRNRLSRTVIGAGKVGIYTVYDAKMDQRIKRDFLMRQTLVNCLQNNMQGFSIHYQPIVNPYTGYWIGAEALCRWSHPLFGRVPPSVFVAQLEQLNLIDQLDQWVLKTAVAQCHKWGLDKCDFILDVNVSPVQMMSEGYITDLMCLLEKNNYPGKKLCLEITESSRFKYSDCNFTTLERLRSYGVSVSLDDFGTGYSGFENLVKIPANRIKTEKSFIDSLESDPYQQYLLRMMVDLAHTAGMEVITEGVETEGQKKLLMMYGVDFFQGYLYSRPLTIAQMNKNLNQFAQE